jgi:hypothetical protein
MEALMKAPVLTAILACVPAIVVAQAGPPPTPPKAPPTAQAQATANGDVELPAAFSASSRAKITATLQTAHSKNLPDKPIRDRIAEGQAKGASEAQIVESAQSVEARLEASQAAFAAAGRAQADQNEIAAGALAMERGASAAHVASLVKHAPADRSLAVSFNVLAKLAANGETVDNAIAKIAAKLDAGATDDAVAALVGGAPPSNSPTTGAAAGANAAATGTAAVSAGKGVTAGVTGAVKGAVSGVVGPKKP